MKRGVKIALIFLSGVVGALVLVTVCVACYLRTPSGSNFLLSQVKKNLVRYASIKMDYTQGSIDPFTTLHFENLKLIQGAGENRMEVLVKTIDIRYAFFLFARRVEVEKVLIDHPSIFLHSVSTAAAKTPDQASSTEKKNDGLESVRKLLVAPPVQISIKRFALEGLNLDVDYQTPAATMKAKLDSLALRFALVFVKRSLSFSGDFDLGRSGEVQLISRSGEDRTLVTVFPSASAKWSATVHQSLEGKWVYEIQPTQMHFGSREITLSQTMKGSSSHLTLNDLRLESNLKLLAKTANLMVLDKNSFESVELKNTLSSGGARGEQAQGEKRNRFSFAAQKATFNADLNKDLALTKAFEIRNLFASAYFHKPARLELASTLHIARDLTQMKAEGLTSLDGVALARFDFAAKAGSDLSLEGHAHVNPDLRLAQIIKPAANLKRIGAVHADLAFKGALKGKFPSFVDADISSPMEGEILVDLVQDHKQGAMAVFEPIHLQTKLTKNGDKLGFHTLLQGKAIQVDRSRLRDVALTAEGEAQKNSVTAKLNAELPEIQANFLKNPWKAGLVTTVGWDASKDEVELDGLLKIQNEDAVRFKGTSVVKPESVQLDTSFEALLGDYLEGVLTKKQLAMIGKWNAKNLLVLRAELPAAKAGSFTHAGVLKMSGSTVITQLRPPGDKSYGLSLPEPIVLNHKINLDHGKTLVEFDGEIPTVEIQKVARIGGTRLISSIRSPDIDTAKDISFSMDVTQGQIKLAKELSADAPALDGLQAKVSANVRNGDQFSLESLSATFNRSMIKMTAEASGRVKRKEFQGHGLLAAEVPKDFPHIAGQAMHGRIEFPWMLSILHGKDITFDGDLDLLDLAWSKGLQHAKGISGRVPVSEKLILNGARLKFAHLITQNPFERVDYERLRPLLHSADQVRIGEIGFEDKTYGPFVGFFSMKQNMLFAHQFDFTLGRSGLADGEMYFDVYPKNLQMGFLTRLTNLNLVEILPKRFVTRIPKGDKNLSGRSGMVVNLNKGSVDGRVDVTEIGGSQLILMLGVLDPKYEDDKINMARTALGVGYPTFVEMVFQKGYLDMGMDIQLPVISKHFDVRGVPISTLVSSATADIVKQTQKGPLQ